MARQSKRLVRLTAIGVPLAAGWALARGAEYPLNLTQGVTPISHEVYRLHMTAFWVCVVIGIIVYGVMAWAIWRHRRSRGAVPAEFHENTRLEVLWTVIPFLVLVGLAIPATQTLMAMENTKNADLTIKVTGQQWRWRYDYMGDDVGFYSTIDGKSMEAAKLGSGIDPATVDHYLRKVDQPLVVPVGKKIRFLFTSSDVIHAWWVPALGYQIDANPGFIDESWAVIDKPGTYRGQCAELCGVDHAFMPIVVEAMEEPQFEAWLAGEKAREAAAAASSQKLWTKADLMAEGSQVYGRICAACHQPNGMGIPGVFPALNGSAIANGPVADHMNRVMNGKAGTAMPAFAKQLSDAEIAGVITFERNSWNNHAGDVIQPAQIEAARKLASK